MLSPSPRPPPSAVEEEAAFISSSSANNPLLALFLRTNAEFGPRLDSSAWDYLTVRDLCRLRASSRTVYDSLEFVEYDRCRDGRDYLVPFPGYPGVLSTEADAKAGSGLFAHQLASLGAMHRAENENTNFGALRGGVLGDAPGLGKTITMLAMVASTSGLRPVEPREFYDRESVDEHWRSVRTNPVFREEILRALRPFRDYGAVYERIASRASPPYSDDRFPTLASFERYVNGEMRGVVSESRRDLFRRNVVAFKAGLDKRNRRFFANERGKRMMFERNLLPCSTTLIVVPDALLEHWAEQIRGHVNLESFVDPNNSDAGGGHGVVYIDGVGDLSTARFPLNHGQIPLPSAFDLADYMIIVVPFLRIKQEFSRALNGRKRQRGDDAFDMLGESGSCASPSPLLQLRWFRIVVDEGHELGQTPAGSDVTKFINQMGAERRWVMSGTPTTGDEDSQDFTSKGLDQLQRLLLFLRHERYGTLPESMDRNNGNTKSSSGRGKRNKHQAKSAWDINVKKPFLNKQPGGREELYRVLDEVMVMHKKEDLSLPKPIFKQSQVDVPVPPDIQSAIIEAVRSTDRDEIIDALSRIGIQQRINSLCTAIKSGGSVLFDALVSEYMATDQFQCLVDETQAKFIIDAVKRERFELEQRGGAILDGITAPITAATNNCSENWVDRRPIKAVVYSSSHKNLLSVANYLYYSFDDQNIAELTEGKIEHMSYDLGRFRHNYKEGKNCPICGGWNEYTGKKLSGCRNRLLEVFDGAISYLIEPERIKRAVGQFELNSLADARLQSLGKPVEMDRLEGRPLTKYSLYSQKWEEGDVLCVDARDPHPLLQKRWGEERWDEYGSARCIELAEEEDGKGKNNFLGPLPYGDGGVNGEVIVRLKKWLPCGSFHSRPRWDARRKKEIGWYKGPSLEHVDILSQKEDTFILLLDASLSHGLDLSFVTHIFLLETINDAALLEQVTSRAHRLGCTAPVIIDTINVWHQMDSITNEVAKRLLSTVQDEAKKRISTAVCEHCYRSFESIDIAEIHELTCDRNPDSNAKVDPYHLSSVYRDIRPPAPMIAGEPDAYGEEEHTNQ